MTEQPKKVYISGNYKGFEEHREKVKNVVEHLKLSTEMVEDEILDTSAITATMKAHRENIDIFIMIMGLRYGHISNPSVGKSDNELEYLKVLEQPQVQRLIYFASDKHPKGEEANDTRLKAFRDTINRNKDQIHEFDSVEDLERQVDRDLKAYIAQKGASKNVPKDIPHDQLVIYLLGGGLITFIVTVFSIINFSPEAKFMVIGLSGIICVASWWQYFRALDWNDAWGVSGILSLAVVLILGASFSLPANPNDAELTQTSAAIIALTPEETEVTGTP